MNTLQTPKGFRDFLPAEAALRQRVIATIRKTFEQFGFEPLETPTLEYASVIMGKYGTEADKLVFRFTDRGDRELALRYDQTVPTARVLAQYKQELPAYFRRYQIQNVFRAEKPQKGRYREFTQCDIDIFGTSSPVADADILACTYQAFAAIGFSQIRLAVNDRRILFDALSQFATDTVSVLSIIQSIDKLDKEPSDAVISELVAKGLDKAQAERALDTIMNAQPTETLSDILTKAVALGVPSGAMQFTPSLARGLDYYTGMIVEVILPEYPIGSFGGGGRYDNLIEQLGGQTTPAVGIAFGFDRIIEAVKALNLMSPEATAKTVLVTQFSASSASQALSIGASLRHAGIPTEVYPAADKLEKQLKYADKKHIPYVVIQGPDEEKRGVIQLKELATKTKTDRTLNEIIDILTRE